jgi:uncharacterized protein (DUF983 family)
MEQIATDGERPVWRAISRGFVGRCPRCNQGRIFRAYLKVNDACPHCGLALREHRADDAPPYVTILIVGHVLVGLMLLFQEFVPNAPVWTNLAIWPALAVLLSLWLLPRVKGALIGYQWALRMHGFAEGARDDGA